MVKIKPDWLNRVRQNIPFQHSTIAILLKCTWNLSKDRQYVGTQINKFTKTEIISSVDSDQNDVKLEIDYKKKVGKIIVCEDWTVCYWITIRSMKIKDQRRNKKNMKTDENKNMTSKSIEYSNSGTKNEIYSNTIYLKKEEKS